MSKKKQNKSTKEIKDEDVAGEKYMLRLFISGILPNSVRAVINSKAICEKYLEGCYELEVIDIYQQPDLALSEDIVAIPALIKKFPLPEVKMIGDLSDTKKVLNGLGIEI